jgi:hypothetical protein
MKLEVSLSCVQNPTTVLCHNLDELISHAYTLLIYSLILSCHQNLGLCLPTSLFPLGVQFCGTLTGLHVIVSCLANLIFLNVITIGLILLGDMYKSWWCAAFSFPARPSGRILYSVGPFRSLAQWLCHHVLMQGGHVPLACTGTETCSYVSRSLDRRPDY